MYAGFNVHVYMGCFYSSAWTVQRGLLGVKENTVPKGDIKNNT